ncbi:MAG: methylated-DNA--[protein]-cysteine S-methyltransferase [Nitrospinota bacterium]
MTRWKREELSIKTKREILFVNSRFGFIGVEYQGSYICRLWLPNSKKAISAAAVGAKPKIVVDSNQQELARDIADYFEGKRVSFNKYKILMNQYPPFTQSVYRKLRSIEFGKTVTYKALAMMVGLDVKPVTIGHIMAQNKIPLIIPCHRVIRSDGAVGGFTAQSAFGTRLKKRMLQLEKSYLP